MHYIFHVSVPRPIKGPCFICAESISPFPYSAHFALGLPLLLIPNPLEATWNSALAKWSPVYWGPVLHRALSLGLQWAANCLKVPWLLWYPRGFKCPTFWDDFFWNVHQTVPPSWIKDQDLNPPLSLRIMKITLDPTTSIHHVMPLLNEKSLLLMATHGNM